MNDLSVPWAGAPDVEALLEGQCVVLEKIAKGAPLPETLESLVALVERSSPGMRCAVLLKVENEPRLEIAAAPNIPEDYRRRIEPFLGIGPDMGASGTAAYRRAPVYNYDTAACEVVGGGFAQVAARNGLRAAWSAPILSDDDEVLGVFAVYYDRPQLPAAVHLRLIAMATSMARIAIQGASRDRLFGCWFGPTILTDLQGTIVRIEEPFARLLGYSAQELRGRNVSVVAPEDYDSLVARVLSPRGYIRGARRYRTRDGRELIVSERRALLRDAAGRARLVVALMENNVEADKHPLSRLSLREREVLELVAAGHTSREIAARLRIAPPSVATYRSRVMSKLGLRHTAGLIRFAIDNGIYRHAA